MHDVYSKWSKRDNRLLIMCFYISVTSCCRVIFKTFMIYKRRHEYIHREKCFVHFKILELRKIIRFYGDFDLVLSKTTSLRLLKWGTILGVRRLFTALSSEIYVEERFSQLTRTAFSRPYPPTPSRLFSNYGR